MDRKVRQFLDELQSADLPPHRQIDPAKAKLRIRNQAGSITVGIESQDGDFTYATRKIIQAAHELFLDLLGNGPYYEYLVEQFGLDLDRY
jgi:hypothetical protein